MSLLDFLFPKKCVGCNKTGSYFCELCIKNIGQSELVCPFCERLALGGITHPACQRKYGLDGLWFLGVYQDPLRAAIKKLKYRYIKGFAERLNEIILEYWVKYPPLFLDQVKKDLGEGWVVVPVPLHWSRKNWRGFNQAELLGKDLAQKLGLEYSEILKRTKNTVPQAKLKSIDRKQNIRGAFSLANNHKPLTNKGTLKAQLESVSLSSFAYNILLIDDVWTTGSTLKECCYVLKKSGSKKVWALTIAR